MSLHPRPIPDVPEETAEIAQAAFPKGNTYMRMRNELGSIFADEQFSELFAERDPKLAKLSPDARQPGQICLFIGI